MSFDRAGAHVGRSFADGQRAHVSTPGKQTLTQSLVVHRSATDAAPAVPASAPPAAAPAPVGSRLLDIFSVGGARGPVQRKQADGGDAPRSSPDETFARATAGGGSDIPYRSQMERAFGQSFTGVRAHLGQAGPMSEI
jgi:hypothetical protein